MKSDLQTEALAAARRLAEAGVPIFVAPPHKKGIGFKLPNGWEKTKADPDIVNDWEPGDALCAVMGHVVDAIDIDPRNGGSLDSLKQALGGELPRVYGVASTPSGGEHYLVATLGLRKVANIVPGVDLQAGNADGLGRGFIFIAPTVRESKSDGQARSYTWGVPPDVTPLLLEGDESGETLVELARVRQGSEGTGEIVYNGLTYAELDAGKQQEADEYVNGCLVGWINKFAEAVEWPEGVREDGGRMRGWEGLTYQFAWALAKMAACPWTSFSEEDAENSFNNILPAPMAKDVPGKWYDGIVTQAADDPVDSPPWVVRGDPSDDFARTPAAWPDVPKSYSDAYLCAWMAHKGLAGDWCWGGGLGWLWWDGRRWLARSDEELVEAVRRALLRLSSRVVAAGDSDAIKSVSGLLGRSRINNIAALMKGVTSASAGSFDQEKDLLNVNNGVVDLRTGDLLPHDRKHRMTKITDADYEPGATHPDWDSVLASLEPEVMDWMQVRFGQAATGWATSDDVLPVGVGGGSNGKSTLLAGIFAALGEHVTLVPDKLLRSSPSDHPTELMTLFGARVAVIEETPEAGHLDVQRLKAVLGTPRITARSTYKDNVSWEATHSLFLMTNYAPQIRETDHGTWRRLALVKFERTFPKKDGFRTAMLSGVGGRREAVLAWLVDGAVRWYEAGGTMPDAPEKVLRDTQVWRGETDQLLAFFQEGMVEKDIDGCILTSDLLEIFNRWLISRGLMKWSASTLVSRITGHRDLSWVQRSQLSSRAGVSQHPDIISEPPARPWVWKGLRWPEDT